MPESDHQKSQPDPPKLLYSEEEIRQRANEIWLARKKQAGFTEQDLGNDKAKTTEMDTEQKRRFEIADWDKAIEELDQETQTFLGSKLAWYKQNPWVETLLKVAFIPLLIWLGSFLVNMHQQSLADQKRDQDLKIANDNRKDDVLKSYFDNMKSLLLEKDHPFKDEKKGEESRSIARTLTLSTLRQLNPTQGKRSPDCSKEKPDMNFCVPDDQIREQKKNESDANLYNQRKGFILEFLQESDLIKFGENFVNLRDADLSHADLSHADLDGANLNYANLNYADLDGANLSGANLNYANLNYADLDGADLSGTDLSGAKLSGAKLSGAILLGTDLRKIKALTKKQLEEKEPPLFCNVALPKRFAVKPNLDCELIPHVLQDRYPDIFTTIEKAKEYVDKLRQKSWK